MIENDSMKLLFFLVFILNLPQAFAHSKFVEECKKHTDLSNTDVFSISQIKWLKFRFKISDCNELVEKLKNLESFSDFIPLNHSGRDNLRHVIPLPALVQTQIKASFLSDYLAMGEKAPDFRNLELFTEFNNLSHYTYDFSHLSKLGSLCNVLKLIGSIKQVSLIYTPFMTRSLDLSCLFESKIEVFILGPLKKEFIGPTFKMKVVGIEDFRGEIGELSKYKHLRYLGIQSYNGKSRLDVFASMEKLTHLWLNIKNVETPSVVRHLTNLEYLVLNCFDSEFQGEFSNETSIRFQCKDSFLENINFLSKLKWLQTLDLTGNNIRDLSGLKSLKNLRFLKLHGNKVKEFPDIDSLKDLEYLDIGGNNLKEISFLRKAGNIRFIDVSGNQIRDMTPLSELSKLKYLVMGGNPIENFADWPPPLALKVLNLNAVWATSSSPMEAYEKVIEYVTMGEPNERDLFLKAVVGGVFDPLRRVDLSSRGTASSWNMFHNFNFEKLQNLEVLSLSGALPLTGSIDFSRLTHLKFLDHSLNKSTGVFSAEKLPNSLIYLDLSHSGLREIPDFSNLPNLISVRLNRNLFTTGSKIKIISNSIRTIEIMNCSLDEMPDFSGTRALKEIILNENRIKHVDGSANLPAGLKHFQLRNNLLSSFPDLSIQGELTSIDLSGNLISNISNLKTLKGREKVTLVHNNILEVEVFRDPALKDLHIDISRNPVLKKHGTCLTDTLNTFLNHYCSGDW